jgi:hypothetical protein
MGVKLGQLAVPLVHRGMAAFDVGKPILQNPLRKTPRASVKVVEGSEIYNFPIHHFVHFYSIFWRFLRSNRSTVKYFRAG